MSLKFTYEALNKITLNQTTQSKTKAYLTKLSYEICILLRYYAA
jgi:hypothetical protein